LAVAASATVYTIVQGLSYPLLALILEQSGAKELEIGVSAAMVPAGMMAAGAGAPRLVRLAGAGGVAAASFCVAAACLLALKAVEQDPALWLPLRFLMGFALACIFTVTDAWVNELTPDESRGRVLGVYSAMLSVGFAIGPGILAVVGTRGWTPFVVGAAFTLAALLPLRLVRKSLPEPGGGEGGASGWSFASVAPALLVGVGVVAFCEQAAMSLLPVWAIAHDSSPREASIMLVVMSIGSIALSVAVGWLADRLPRRLLVAGCAATTAGCAVAISFVETTEAALLWPVLFFFGGAYYAIYVLSLVRLGQHFSGQMLVAGAAAFGAAWGLGGVVGPSLTGAVMSQIGPPGLPLTLAALFCVIVVVNLLPAGKGRRKPAAGERAGDGA
jgi:MFS family permease